MKKEHVVGIGQCALDYLFVVDSFPAADTKKEVLSWTVCGGGPVATALVTLSRLGIECTFYGITGDDEIGRNIRESLEKENINVQGLRKRADSCSQTAFIAVEQRSGKRTIFWRRPSGAPLRADEIPDHFLDTADFVLLDGLMVDASRFAAERAKKENVPVLLDAGRIREGMLDLAGTCDYVVASEEFGKDLNGEEGEILQRPESALLRMKQFGNRACTLTLGERGSLTVSGDTVFHIPAFRVDVADTTGAGDVFHGGYIYGLLQGWGIEHVVRFATACASLKCRKAGGREGIPTLGEVNAFLGGKEAQ